MSKLENPIEIMRDILRKTDKETLLYLFGTSEIDEESFKIWSKELENNKNDNT